MIKNDNIIMGEESLKNIREYYPKLIDLFIEKNLISYYDEIVKVGAISDLEIDIILLSNLDYRKKIDILNLFKKPLSISGKAYKKTSIDHILQNNFNLLDLPVIISNYSNYYESTKKIAFSLILSNISKVINEIEHADVQLLKLLLDEDINEDMKKYICAKLCEKATSTEIVTYLKKLSEREFDGVFNHKQSTIVNNTHANKELLDQLKKQDFILSYQQEGKTFKFKRNRKIFKTK